MTGNEHKQGKKKYVIVHGHFYQPPRENPWLEIIEKQASASPDHDWNERIFDQCYRPNATSRLLDSKGMIVDIQNNYAFMSYNFGPTLFRWLQKNHEHIAQKIIQADKDSQKRLNNHGNAIAQVYNHMIMPLASRRDQLTQIRWAKSYFKQCFNRNCEGIWLAETAINMETITCLIEEDIRYVILSPTQAHAIRRLNSQEDWYSVADGRIDTRCAYRIYPRNKDGQQLSGFLDVFFFDEGLSREVSFGNLLGNASTLGDRINACFDDSIENQVVVIATDGETFGHHKAFGDMCLAYYFKHIAKEMNVEPVNFGYFLEKNPPVHEVILKNEFGEGTAWSCQHGVGRWSRDCGCNAGGPAGWNQKWREPLRTAFNNLQQHVDKAYLNVASPFIQNPWDLRDAYMDFYNTGSLDGIKNALVNLGVNTAITQDQLMMIKRMLEAQKFMLFSYTSCGWFFSELSGIETVQNIAYAARALSMAIPENEKQNVIHEFSSQLSIAKSNFPGKDGATLFNAHVKNYMEHLPILCFTAIVEKSTNPSNNDSFSVSYFGYAISISHVPNNSPEYDVFHIKIANTINGEQGEYRFLVTRNIGKMEAWYLQESIAIETVFDATKPETIKKHVSIRTIDLSSIFQESKSHMGSYFLNTLSKDTQEKYALWMEQNSRSLDSLCELGIPLPQYIAAPISYVLTCRWNLAINAIEVYGHEDDVYAQLLQLWRMSNNYGITIDYSKSAELLLDLLIAELRIFSETLSIVSSERMRYLLNIIDRFAIPFSKNKIEDVFYAILHSSIQPLYAEFSKSNNKDQKENIIKLIHFARRMNFNTDAFPLG